jgi:hypothetical protein
VRFIQEAIPGDQFLSPGKGAMLDIPEENGYSKRTAEALVIPIQYRLRLNRGIQVFVPNLPAKDPQHNNHKRKPRKLCHKWAAEAVQIEEVAPKDIRRNGSYSRYQCS